MITTDAGACWVAPPAWLTLPLAGHTLLVVIVVTRVGGDGSVLTRAVDTARRTDPRWWDALVEQAALGIPRPYRARPGDAVSTASGPAMTRFSSPSRICRSRCEILVIAVLAEGDC